MRSTVGWSGTRGIGALIGLLLAAGCGDDTTGSGAGASGGGGATSSSSSAGGGGAGGGGGGLADDDDSFESGTRLRAIVLDGGGGARRFEGWYDTELETECELRQEPGDELRCLPTTSATIGYRDAACTQPVWVKSYACDPDEGYVVDQIPATEPCNANDSLHHLAYRVLGDAGVLTEYYELGTNGCASKPVPTSPIKLVEEVPIESFVALTQSVVPIDQRVGRLTYTSEDGASVVRRAHDLERDESCSLMDPLPADGAHRCIPTHYRRYPAFAYWADGACGVPAVTIGNCSSVDLPILDFEFVGACGETNGVLREPGEVVAPPLYETFGLNPQCIVQNNVSGLGAGAPIPLEGFPTLDESVRGTGALELVRTARQGVALSPYGDFRTATDGRRCTPRLVADGSWRCVPSANLRTSFTDFADAGCTVPIAYVGRGDLSCGAYEFAGLTDDEPCVDQVLELYTLGAQHEGPVYRLSSAGCQVLDAGDDVYAELGASIDLTSLPLIELYVD